MKSYAYIDLKSPIIKMDIYTRNNIENTLSHTFKVIVQKQEETTSVISIILISISICIFVILISTCCFRMIMGARQSGSQIDWSAFEEPDPNWDEDQVRIYNIRRLESQLDELDIQRVENDNHE